MNRSKEKKKAQLGIDPGTAQNRLKKMLLFDMARRLDLNYCIRCAAEITSIHDFTVDHVEPWLDSEDPVHNFYDLENVGFSHVACNYSESRGGPQQIHPSLNSYKRGCRCDECRELKGASDKAYRARKKAKRFNQSDSDTEQGPHS